MTMAEAKLESMHRQSKFDAEGTRELRHWTEMREMSTGAETFERNEILI